MAKEMIATFSDEAYAAYKSGEAVDNNGFRSKKGNYYPDQPTFREKDQYQDQFKDAGVKLLIDAAGYVTFEVVLPEVQRFTHEKVYPFFSEKWDAWRTRKSRKADETKVTPVPATATVNQVPEESGETSENCKIINLEDYRKRA